MNENENQFFKMPLYFFDYGLQVFTHTEYDILQYILRNTIGWNKLECELSIKNMALMKKYSEKNIIKSINNLVEKTNVFNKIVYREKGSYIKKTKYIITENSINILNDYIRKNLPSDLETKKEKIKNRNIEAENRLKEGREKLLEKQKEVLPIVENEVESKVETETENVEPDNQNKNKEYLLSAWQEILNDYDSGNCRYSLYGDVELHNNIFSEWKQIVYRSYLDYLPKETDTEKIDMRLSDLLRFTNDIKTIELYNTLIKNKKMIGGQKDYFYNTLKINFHIDNERNFDRINVMYE